MKSLLRAGLCAVAVVVLALCACKGGGSPKGAFEGWLKAMEACDAAQIKAGITNDSAKQLEEMMKLATAMMPEEERKNFNFYKEICKSFKPGAAQVTGEVVTGDTAVLTVKMDNKEDKIPMKKEDGNWKVDFASAFKGGPGGGDEPPPPPAPSPAPSPTPAPAPAPAPAP